MSLEDQIPGEEFESIRGKFKDVESLAKAYRHMESMQGKSVRLPETDIERQDLLKKLGQPDSIDGYGEGGDRELAKDLGLLPDQYEKLKARNQITEQSWNDFVTNEADFEAKQAAVKAAAESLGINAKNDPEQFRLLAEIGKTMSNDTAPGGTSGQGPTDTQRNASRLREILNNPIYTDRRAKNTEEGRKIHAEASLLYRELFEAGFNSPYDKGLIS